MSKGICFIKPMFNKVVAGEKTQTRRIITDLESLNKPTIKIELSDNNSFAHFISENMGEAIAGIVSRYRVGKTVYLKEPYAETCDECGTPIIAYKFGGKPRLKLPDSLGCEMDTDWCIDNYPACGKWKNKLFMPESAARHFIEIIAVRAERLQDVSEEDCLKEGIEEVIWKGKMLKSSKHYFNGYESYDTPIEAYAELIDRINGKGIWERNPFVWVYDFKLLE